jgi:hypothetical protein
MQDADWYKVVKGRLPFDTLLRAIAAKKIKLLNDDTGKPTGKALKFYEKPSKNMAQILDPELDLVISVFRTQTGGCFFEAYGDEEERLDLSCIIDAIEAHFKVTIDETRFSSKLAKDKKKK